MAVSPQDMQAWCGTLLAGRAANPDLSLADYLDAIPGLGSIEELPERHRGAGPRRRRRQAGGNRRRGRYPPAFDGRHAQIWPRARLEADHLWPHRPQAGRLAGQGGQAAGRDARLRGHADRRLARREHDDDPPGRERSDRGGRAGRVLMLENTRQYDIERVLWKAKPADCRRSRRSSPSWPTNSPRRSRRFT